jgi:hypothetical protein
MFKVWMTHLQMGAVLLRFDLQWPAALLSLFSSFDKGSSVTSHVVSTECILKALAPAVSPFYISSAVILLLLPFCLVAVVNVVLIIRNARSANRISNRAMSIIILNMLYATLTRQVRGELHSHSWRISYDRNDPIIGFVSSVPADISAVRVSKCQNL